MPINLSKILYLTHISIKDILLKSIQFLLPFPASQDLIDLFSPSAKERWAYLAQSPMAKREGWSYSWLTIGALQMNRLLSMQSECLHSRTYSIFPWKILFSCYVTLIQLHFFWVKYQNEDSTEMYIQLLGNRTNWVYG